MPAPTDEQLRDYLYGRFPQGRNLLQGSNAPVAKAIDEGLAVAEKMQRLGVSVGGDGISGGFGSHPYRFTEFCLPAGRVTHVLGSCTENPNPTDDTDRNLIRRGQNEKTFLISTKSGKKLERSLRLQSVALILIGAVLVLGGAAVGLHSAHMLAEVLHGVRWHWRTEESALASLQTPRPQHLVRTLFLSMPLHPPSAK